MTGLINFLIVLGFNVFWFISYEQEFMLDLLTFKLDDGKIGIVASFLYWIYLLWGLLNLLYFIYD